MSLLVLMYHRARAGRFGNAPEMLDAHFAHLAQTCANVLPGDPLSVDKLNVCVSFDDGYFDFYSVVFPLLKKHNLRALLAIPPGVVPERVDLSDEARLGVETEEAFVDPSARGFCTWTELEEMTRSSHVTVAAHGFAHCRLDHPEANLVAEVQMPKKRLMSRLGQPIDSFVFPYGRYSRDSLHRAKQTYRWVFRIGGALNRSWQQRMLYRVDADNMESPTSLLSPKRLSAYRARYFWNRLRLN